MAHPEKVGALEELAAAVHALEKIDGAGFRRRARVLQSLWREEQGYPCGEHSGRLLGSRLPMPWAKDTLANYLTDGIKDVVRREVLDPTRSKGKLYGRPRIYDDLLSSQPLAFNLFGELQADLSLTSKVISATTAGRFPKVTAIGFEESPGRSDPRYTGDRSAFDVFIECQTSAGVPAFIGVEVKYHENLKDSPAKHRPRYDELADAMGCFRPESRDALRGKPLQQLWRDHLLAGALLADGPYQDGLFAFLFPRDNEHCFNAVEAYRACLDHDSTFAAWTLESFTQALATHTDATWVRQFVERYLGFTAVDRALSVG